MPKKGQGVSLPGNYTLLEINISHLGTRKIIFKYALSGGYVNSLEGIPLKRTPPKKKKTEQLHENEGWIFLRGGQVGYFL